MRQQYLTLYLFLQSCGIAVSRVYTTRARVCCGRAFIMIVETVWLLVVETDARNQRCVRPAEVGTLRSERSSERLDPLTKSGLPIVFLAMVLALLPAPSSAQEFTLRGRVVDSENQQPIGFATVTLPEGQLLADRNGRFEFKRRVGRYTIRLSAIGYVSDEVSITLTDDLTITFELDRDPVRLDSIVVTDRRVTLRGIVRDSASGVKLIDAEVQVPPERRLTTDAIGRFKFSKMPAYAPLDVRIAAFGYLPLNTKVSLERDSTVEFRLQPDPVVQRMLTIALGRIDNRSAPYRRSELPVIERQELMRNLDATVADLIKLKLGPSRMRKVACVVVDEKTNRGNLLATMLPDQVDRIEVIQPPAMADHIMIRVYTRPYMKLLMANATSLVPTESVKMPSGLSRLCR